MVVWDVEDDVVDEEDEDDCIGVFVMGMDIVIEISEIDELWMVVGVVVGVQVAVK